MAHSHPHEHVEHRDHADHDSARAAARETHRHPGATHGAPHDSGTGLNHDAHKGHSPDAFRDKFWLSLLLSVPVVVWSQHIQELLGYSAPALPFEIGRAHV